MSRGLGMWHWLRRILWHGMWLFVLPAHKAMAGQSCVQTPLSGEQLIAAAATANDVQDALIQADRPVALLARVGNDLSKHGLYFSHIAVARRSPEAGTWRVWHLLNTCGTDDAGLFVDGLFDYYARHLTSQNTKLILLTPAMETDLAQVFDSGQAVRLFQPHYNVIAPPGKLRSQNSTAYILELLAAAEQGQVQRDRQAIWQTLKPVFQPDVLAIPYRKRIMGGLFTANADFSDHPVATRLRGDYPVVTVHAIMRYLDQRGLATKAWVIHDGQVTQSPIELDGVPNADASTPSEPTTIMVMR
ncbi:hypothetical protein C7S18_21375 [Ahniella affigens]|uniref:DUF2145 domain-containing protein n=1 Tax=Ahniella affigens TaxID=2021234 RepID=A0A2P1PXK6_9GAMM|nr:DUF2145 domain-containing protein [Ahniella affigens]AVP99566.1 hypothetical protein C7S18_21375 [Ahniella affigens]